MVLTELPSGIAERFEQIRHGRRPFGNAVRRSGHTDGQQPCPKRLLAEDERCSARSAALLRVSIGKDRPFMGNPVDVRCPISHYADAVGTDMSRPISSPHMTRMFGCRACAARLAGNRTKVRETKTSTHPARLCLFILLLTVPSLQEATLDFCVFSTSFGAHA